MKPLPEDLDYPGAEVRPLRDFAGQLEALELLLRKQWQAEDLLLREIRAEMATLKERLGSLETTFIQREARP